MIAIVVSSFLLLILFTIWDSTRDTFSTSGSLSDLQDKERLALSIIANTVHVAGYYPVYLNYETPAPAKPYSTSDFTVSGSMFASGQVAAGTHSSSAPGDSLLLRFIADKNLDTLDCLGQSEGTGTLVTNTFSVKNGDLQCSVNGGTAQTIVSGVSNMSVLFGVDQKGNGSPSQYMDANAVTTAGDWSAVVSVIVSLTFDNPLAGQAGQSMTLTPIRRVMALMQTVH